MIKAVPCAWMLLVLTACSSSSSSPNAAVASSDAGAGEFASDGGTETGEASKDARVPSTTSDASDAASSCTPKNVPVLDSWPPPVEMQGFCSETQIQSFWDACLSPAPGGDCHGFQNANRACAGCLMTYETAAPVGAVGIITLIDAQTEYLSLNVTGCMTHLARTSAEQTCAKATGDRDVCHLNYCLMQCASNEALAKCKTEVESTFCKTQDDAADVACADWATPGSLFDRCYDADWNKRFFKVARALCAPMATNGSDAGDGG